MHTRKIKRFKLKKFLVFVGMPFYPSGGWDDFVGTYDSKIGAIRVAKKFILMSGIPMWAEVVDTEGGEVVELSSDGVVKRKKR